MKAQCEQLMDWLGSDSLPPKLADHAASCDVCASLIGAFSAVPTLSVPAPRRLSSALDRAHEELTQHPAVIPWWRDTLWLTVMQLWLALGGTLALGKHGFVQNHAAAPALITVGFLVLGVIGWGAYAMAVPRSHIYRLAFLVFASETALLVLLAGSGHDARPFWRLGLGCAEAEVATSIAPIVAVLWVLRKSAYDPLRSFTAGLGAAATGTLVLHMHCPIGTAQHLVMFHVLPWFLLAALTTWIRSTLPSHSFAP